MKELKSSYYESNETIYSFNINKNKLIKYLIMFCVVSSATLIIPTCGVLKSHAIVVGLLSSTTFAVIDTIFPNNIYVN